MRVIDSREVLLALSLSACAGGRPAVPRLIAPVAPVARIEQTAIFDACLERDGLVIEPIEPIAADWQGAATIGGRGEVTVRWCGAGVVTITSLTLGRPASASELAPTRSIRTLDPARSRLAHGESLTDAITAPAQPGPLVLRVEASTDDGVASSALADLESVDDPERVARRAECDAAGGRWGPQGMAGHESCDRPTRDAGRRCTSDADCEGPCIDADSEPLGAAPPDGVEVPTCGPGRQPRLLVGRCYERSIRFGCHPRLFEVTIECGSVAFGRRAHLVCVD